MAHRNWSRLTDNTEKRIYGIHHNATESRIAQEAEAKAEDREQIVADTEHGTQGEADGARGEAGGGNRALTPPAPRSLQHSQSGVRRPRHPRKPCVAERLHRTGRRRVRLVQRFRQPKLRAEFRVQCLCRIPHDRKTAALRGTFNCKRRHDDRTAGLHGTAHVRDVRCRSSASVRNWNTVRSCQMSTVGAFHSPSRPRQSCPLPKPARGSGRSLSRAPEELPPMIAMAGLACRRSARSVARLLHSTSAQPTKSRQAARRS